MKCAACGYDGDIPTPILDEHARRVRAYLARRAGPVATAELHDELGIPRGTLLSRWFRARARAIGVESSRSDERLVVWELAP